MKILQASTLAALALGLMLSGSAAYAADGNGAQGNQDQHQNGEGDKNDHGDNDKNHHAKPPVTKPAPANTNTPNGGHNGDNANNANNNNGNGDNMRRVDRRHPKNWNNRNTRTVDMSRWHRNANAQRQYHAGTYRAPRGYSYVHYSYGQRLPRDYYDRSFWLLDFLAFGLESPPPGYTWVRYGPDALLIDEETGEIVQVQYNVFYS